jgi:hypothetical protein
VRDPNATPCYTAWRALAIFLAGQHKRVQARPETDHLPDFHRDVRSGLKAAVGWLTQRYTPP